MTLRYSLLTAVALGAIATFPCRADVSDRPFDFSDAFLLANGINPATVVGRPEPNGTTAVIDNNVPGPQFRNVRLLQHAACYDHSGHPTYFHVTGLVFPNTFTNNAAGQQARTIAESFKIYEFPRSTAAQFSVFPKNQDAVADLRNGYFSNDPLGIWQVNIVRYAPAAFNTTAGQQALAELATRNGLTLDGTPVIRTLSEIEDLRDDGFITITVPPADGTALRWFMCPIPQDLTDGTIAPDAHVDVVRQANGLPLPASAEHVSNFHCLQATGDFCHSDCRSDIDRNRSVDVNDLLFVISSWGPCPGCLQDTDNSGVVNVNDLLRVVSEWGACP